MATTASRPHPSGSTPRDHPSASAPTPSSSGLTPRQPGDSPERANKRARFTAPDAAGGGGAGTPRDARSANAGTPRTPGSMQPPTPTPRSTTGPVGNGGNASSGGTASGHAGDKVKEGMRWVKEKLAEMEVVYKETILAATLITQHKIYCRKIGLRSAPVPLHMTARLERAWCKYEALRRHLESYLLQCAQAAATPSKSLTCLPTPGTLPSLGLTPLPTVSPVPIDPSSLLGLGTVGMAGSDTSAVLDPNALAGYSVVPSLSAVSPNTANLERLAAQVLGGPPPLSDQVQVDSVNGGAGTVGSAMDIGLGMGSGMDLSQLGMDELNALLSGENIDFANMDMSGLMVPPATVDNGGGGDGAGQVVTNDSVVQSVDPVPAAVITETNNYADRSKQTAHAEPTDAAAAISTVADQSDAIRPTSINAQEPGISSAAQGAPQPASLEAGSGMPATGEEFSMADFDFSALGDMAGGDLGDLDLSNFADLFAQGQGQGQEQVPGAGSQAEVQGAAEPVGVTSTFQGPQATAIQPIGEQQPQLLVQPAPPASQQSQIESLPPQQQGQPVGPSAAPIPQQSQQTSEQSMFISPDATQPTSLGIMPPSAAQVTHGSSDNQAVLDPATAAANTTQSASTTGGGNGTAPATGEFDLANFNGDLGGIDFDDFNFENMPDVGGDEFDRMFAEFE